MDLVLDDPTWDTAGDELAWQARLTEDRSLIDAQPETLSPDGVIDLLREIQREQARLSALEARALVAAAGPFEQRREITVLDRDRDVERTLVLADETREELSAALHRSPGVVHDEVCVARMLLGALPRTALALSDGRISARHARVIAEQARRITGAARHLFDDPRDDAPDQAAERARFLHACQGLEERVLPWAYELTSGQLRTRVRRVIADIDAEGQERRRREARRDVDVELIPEDDGLALLLARLPLEQAARVHAALDACARSMSGDSMPTDGDAGIGARRVQALVDAVCGTALEVGAPGSPATVTTEIQIVIPLAALTGHCDAPATIAAGTRQPEPISAQAVRDLLADPACPTSLRRLLVDEHSGRLLDRGRRSYAVSDAMRAFLATRDQTCRFPGCTRAALRCQIDHAVPWDDGGATDRDNLGPLCTRHHQLKTHGGWELTRTDDDGTVEWRSPAGRDHRVRPPTPGG